MTQKQVRKLVRRFSKILGLTDWDIRVKFPGSPPPDHPRWAASIISSSVPLTAFIDIYDVFFTQEKDEQEETLFHELYHAVLSPLREEIDALYNGQLISPNIQESTEEHVVNHLGRSMYLLYRSKGLCSRRIKHLK